MAYGFKFNSSSSAFAESARLYNPKLFNALKGRSANLALMPTPKSQIDQFASNFEEMLGDVEGMREPMRRLAAPEVAVQADETSAA